MYQYTKKFESEKIKIGTNMINFDYFYAKIYSSRARGAIKSISHE
jgi:hypothetical protein